MSGLPTSFPISFTGGSAKSAADQSRAVISQFPTTITTQYSPNNPGNPEPLSDIFGGISQLVGTVGRSNQLIASQAIAGGAQNAGNIPPLGVPLNGANYSINWPTVLLVTGVGIAVLLLIKGSG